MGTAIWAPTLPKLPAFIQQLQRSVRCCSCHAGSASAAAAPIWSVLAIWRDRWLRPAIWIRSAIGIRSAKLRSFWLWTHGKLWTTAAAAAAAAAVVWELWCRRRESEFRVQSNGQHTLFALLNPMSNDSMIKGHAKQKSSADAVRAREQE